MRMEKKRAFLINIGYYGFFVILLLLAGKYLIPVLTPFIVAFVLAFLIQRPAEGLARMTGISRKHLAVPMLILLYIILFGVVLLGGGKAFSMIRSLIISIPGIYRREILPFLNDMLELVGANLSKTDPFVSSQIENSLEQVVENIGQMVSTLSVNILQMVSEYITRIPSALIRIVITVVTSFYMCADYERIMNAIWSIMPETGRQTCRDIKKYGLNMIKVYLKSYSLLLFMTFAELTIGFLILRIPHPFIVALVIAVFDILPVLGTGGILIPWAVVLAVIGNYSLAVGIMLLYLVVTVIRNSVEPRIVGRQIGLHPLLTLIAMFTGVSLAGLPGLILLPMAVMIFVNMMKNGAIHIGGRGKPDEAGRDEQ